MNIIHEDYDYNKMVNVNNRIKKCINANNIFTKKEMKKELGLKLRQDKDNNVKNGLFNDSVSANSDRDNVSECDN